eukprot:gene5185-27747_t
MTGTAHSSQVLVREGVGMGVLALLCVGCVGDDGAAAAAAEGGSVLPQPESGWLTSD